MSVNRAVVKNNLSKVLINIFIYLIVLFLLFPIFWMVMTSFKPQNEWVNYPPNWIPKMPTLDNYQSVILGVQESFGKTHPSAIIPYLNTVFLSVVSTFVAIVVGVLGAYGLSRFKAGKSKLISIIMPRMFPPMAMIIPIMIFFQIIGAIDTYWGIIIVYVGFTLPYSVFMIKGFMDGVPKEITEAALLDNLSEWQILYKIWIPFVKNGLMTTALFLLILNWTEYSFALTLSSREIQTITLSLAKMFSNEAGTYYGPQSALGVLGAIPTIIFGMLIHKHLAYGFTFGALKQ